MIIAKQLELIVLKVTDFLVGTDKNHVTAYSISIHIIILFIQPTHIYWVLTLEYSSVPRVLTLGT